MKKQLNKNDVETINAEIEKSLHAKDFFSKKDQLMLVEENGKRVIVKDKLACFFYLDGRIVPTLKLLLQKQFLKQIVVDMGAVKFVSSGADVMRPGITEIDMTLAKDELVAVVDQTHKKPLAVCLALFSGEEMSAMKTGKVLKNLHHVGDEMWKFEA